MGHSFEIMILYTVYASKYICKEQQLQTRIQMQTLEVIKMENAKKKKRIVGYKMVKLDNKW